MVNDYLNTLSYVYTGAWYWTMSPSYFSHSNSTSNVWNVNGTGNFNNNWVTNGNGVRPARFLLRLVKLLMHWALLAKANNEKK